MENVQDANYGKVTQVIGSTFDAEFAEEHLPPIYNALRVEVPRTVLGETSTDTLWARCAAPGRRPRPLRRPRLDRRPASAAWRSSTPARRSRCRSARRRSAACSTCSASRSTAAGRSPPRSGGRSTASRRSSTTSRPRPRCSRPASRSSTCSRPFVRGGKAGLFGGAGAGQDGHPPGADRPHRPASTAATRCFAGVGERTREGNDLWLEMQEAEDRRHRQAASSTRP